MQSNFKGCIAGYTLFITGGERMRKLVSLILVFLILTLPVLANELSEDEFLYQLNTIADMEALQYMFEKNNGHVDMKTVKPSMYYNLDSSGLTRFYRDIIRNRPYISIEDAEQRLDFFLVLESINTNKYPVIEEAFAYAEKYYELNLVDLYSLCETHREQAINEFTKYHSHMDMTDVQVRLDNITDKYLPLEEAEIAALIPLDKVQTEDTADLTRITVSDWAKKEVEKAAASGIIPKNLGVDYTKPITREKFCEIAYLAALKLTKFSVKNVESHFQDTNSEAVMALYNADVIKGTDAAHFSPDKEISREESAVIVHRLSRYLKIKTDDTDYKMISKEYLFSDHENISDWAKQACYSLKRSNVMNGIGNNLFAPEGTYTIEQALAVILRITN